MTRIRGFVRALRPVAGALLIAFLCSGFALTFSQRAGATTSTSTFYLDLGGSASRGVQPSPYDPHGVHTDHGFSNDVVALEAAKGVQLQLTELGCSGETTDEMVFGDDNCYHGDGSQLVTAVAFLRAHADQTGIVTIDLGFNDLRPCFASSFLDPSCVNAALSHLEVQLPVILGTLEAAAGPNVTFVGLDYWDPFLPTGVLGLKTQQFVTESVIAVNQLNADLQQVYAAASVPVANVAKAFDNGRHSDVQSNVLGTAPKSMAAVCAMTWMCARPPLGPNIHPRDSGYRAMAEAIVDELTVANSLTQGRITSSIATHRPSHGGTHQGSI